MKKVVKRDEVEDDKTIIYMIVGFCVGAIISLLCFEYYWVGVGGGAGMLVGILVSTVVDYLKAQNEEKVIPAKVKKTSKKTSVKKSVK